MPNARLYLNYHGLVKVNQIYFFLKKLPLLGKKLPPSPRISYEGKSDLASLGILFRLLICLLNSAGVVAFYYLPWTFNAFSFLGLEKVDPGIGFFQSFFFLSLLAAPYILRQGRQELDWTGYYFLKTFRFPARGFFLNRISLNLVRIAIGLLIPMLMIGWLVKDFITVILAYLSTLLVRVFVEAFFLWLYESKGKTVLEKPWVSIVFTLLMALLAFLPIFEALGKTFIHVCFPFSLLGALWGSHYLKRANYEKLAAGLSTTEELEASKEAIQGASFLDVKIEEEDIALTEAEMDAQKDGYAYLHELIFNRIQKKLDKSTKSKVKVIAVLGLLLFIAGVNFRQDLGGEMDKMFIVTLKSSFFLSYVLSPGEKFAKLLFLYMDKDFLPFHYYREPKAILGCLRIRLQKLLKITAPITGIILVSLLAFFGLFYQELGSKIFLFIPALLVQGAFFALYRLMVYYLLQPYTLKMEAKSPGASIANALVYMVSYAYLQIKEIGPISIAILSGLMGLIALMAPFILMKMGPKSFKLREG